MAARYTTTHAVKRRVSLESHIFYDKYADMTCSRAHIVHITTLSLSL